MHKLINSVVTLANTDVSATVKHARTKSLLLALMGLFALTAYAFGLGGITLLVAAEYDAIAAWFAMCAGMVVLALSTLVVVKVTDARARKVAVRNRPDEGMTMLVTSLGLTALPIIMRSRGLMTLTALGGAAFMASKFVDRKDALNSLSSFADRALQALDEVTGQATPPHQQKPYRPNGAYHAASSSYSKEIH